MRCQKQITKYIVENHADYILCIKKNQRNFHDFCHKIFSEDTRLYLARYFSRYFITEKSHGQKGTKECIAYEPEDCLSYIFKEWIGLRSLIKLTCTREIEGQKLDIIWILFIKTLNLWQKIYDFIGGLNISCTGNWMSSLGKTRAKKKKCGTEFFCYL